MPADLPDWTPARRALGERLRSLRRAAGLSQQAVGEMIGVDRRTVSGWEWGTSVPSYTDLLSLAWVLDTPVAALLAD